MGTKQGAAGAEGGMTMRYLSLFDGIGAACVAWGPLGWKCVGVSEVEPFPIAVTTHHRPHVPHLGDVTKITEEQIAALGRVDLIVGGFPCQDVSVAGKRAGLRNEDGSATRSGLFFDAMRIVRWAREHCGLRWLLIENVPGLYSSNGGRDFAVVVGSMAGLELSVPEGGWGTEGVALGENGLVEWCVLDAQWFGVAQRRRRVFALLDAGDWSNRPPILLEPESLRGDPPTRGGSGKGAPAGALRSTDGGSDVDHARARHLIPAPHADLSPALKVSYAIQAGALRQNPESGPDGVGVQPDIAYTLEARAEVQCVAFDTTQITSKANGSNPQPDDPCHTLAKGSHAPAIAFNASQDPDVSGLAVRRLTPRECERLQGFPDDYTRIPQREYARKRITALRPPDRWEPLPNGHWMLMSADDPRYKALGNSMAVPVMRWIGRRIDAACAAAKRSAA